MDGDVNDIKIHINTFTLVSNYSAMSVIHIIAAQKRKEIKEQRENEAKCQNSRIMKNFFYGTSFVEYLICERLSLSGYS